MRVLAVLIGLAVVLGGPTGCGPTGAGDDGTSDGGRDAPVGPCQSGQKQCELGSNAFQTCQNGAWVTSVTCPLACDSVLGCVECLPNSKSCSGNDVVQCTPQGTPGNVVAHCTGPCANGQCNDPCGQAEANKGYLGCDYWPTVTMNSGLDTTAGFNFAVAVANASQSPAAITITGGALTATKTETVQPGQIATITLPWVTDLKMDQPVWPDTQQKEKSILKPNGAYHLVSDQPVSVYQFNALEYVVGSGPGAGYSYTNDASLLLPRHVLGDETGASNYLVVTRPTHEVKFGTQTGWSPGFFSAVGTEDSTQVTIKFTAATLAGTNIPQMYAVGDTASFALNKGTVLMMASAHNETCAWSAPDHGSPGTTCATNGPCYYCDLSNGYDLTGTEITSDKPIAVFGGHNCSFVPYDKWACDHLEEQLFPVTAWGKAYVATRAVSTNDPNLWRIISGHDGNQIDFNPASVHASITLNKGEWVEFVTTEDFEVAGLDAFMVAGFMVGQNYSSTVTNGAPGDPSMTLAVPTEQYRKQYVFLAPESYEKNYVNIVAKTGAEVLLDGNQITTWAPVGSGVWSVAKVTIQGGSHTIQTNGTDGVGIQVYGVGSYTSYMYPGGLDVKQINIPG
ncbi:MAG TPA: IgGFc-binding protein [Polyangia bacterium]|jgi:hypothetical protein